MWRTFHIFFDLLIEKFEVLGIFYTLCILFMYMYVYTHLASITKTTFYVL